MDRHRHSKPPPHTTVDSLRHVWTVQTSLTYPKSHSLISANLLTRPSLLARPSDSPARLAHHSAPPAPPRPPDSSDPPRPPPVSRLAVPWSWTRAAVASRRWSGYGCVRRCPHRRPTGSCRGHRTGYSRSPPPEQTWPDRSNCTGYGSGRQVRSEQVTVIYRYWRHAM